jgi:hypothetical protein
MTNIAPASRQALAQISLPTRKTKADLIDDVVADAMRAGFQDVSMREVQARLMAAHGLRLDLSTISARCNELVSAGRLLRSKTTRPCSITGQGIHGLSKPMVQTSIPGYRAF